MVMRISTTAHGWAGSTHSRTPVARYLRRMVQKSRGRKETPATHGWPRRNSSSPAGPRLASACWSRGPLARTTLGRSAEDSLLNRRLPTGMRVARPGRHDQALTKWTVKAPRRLLGSKVGADHEGERVCLPSNLPDSRRGGLNSRSEHGCGGRARQNPVATPVGAKKVRWERVVLDRPGRLPGERGACRGLDGGHQQLGTSGGRSCTGCPSLDVGLRLG